MAFGAAAIISGELVAEIASTFSLASVTITRELNYLLKPLGLYLMMFGGLMAYAIIDPGANRVIITWGAWVLLLRALQRLLLTGELNELFRIPVTRNLAHVAYLSVLGLVLLRLRPKRFDRTD